MPSTRGFEPTTPRSRGECPTTALQPQPNYRTLVWLGLRWLSVFEPMTSLQPTPRRPPKQRPKLVQKSPLGWLVWHVKIILNETGQLSMKSFLLLQSLPFSSHTSSAILFPFQLAATTTTTTATFTTSKVFFQHTKEHIFSSSSLFHWRHKHKISRNSLSLYCWMFFHRQNNLDVVHITSQHFNTVASKQLEGGLSMADRKKVKDDGNRHRKLGRRFIKTINWSYQRNTISTIRFVCCKNAKKEIISFGNVNLASMEFS